MFYQWGLIIKVDRCYDLQISANSNKSNISQSFRLCPAVSWLVYSGQCETTYTMLKRSRPTVIVLLQEQLLFHTRYLGTKTNLGRLERTLKPTKSTGAQNLRRELTLEELQN
jgi:hypothetical protein